jgi:hypothetical protein
MLCALVACALIVGTADRCQPGPQQVEYIKDPAIVATHFECAEFFHALQEILPPFGISPRRFEFSNPREPNPEVASANEMLRSK